MKTVHSHSLNESTTGSSYKNYRGVIEVSLIEDISPQEGTVIKADMSVENAHSLFKALRNSLIEAKVIRGKIKY